MDNVPVVQLQSVASENKLDLENDRLWDGVILDRDDVRDREGECFVWGLVKQLLLVAGR